jgi:aryl-alcohol dehydrogenase-like predicted oxidoreductase
MPTNSITADCAGTWTLGDLTVNRIGFGAMRLTAKADGTATDRDRVVGLLRRAVELGVNHIDTAAFYFSATRSANEIISRALAPYPDGLVITTKVGPSRDRDGAWMPMATPAELRGQIEENLRQLGRDHLDVVNLRLLPGIDDIGEHYAALAALRDEGLIRHLGLSSAAPHRLAQAQAVAPVVCVQNSYGIDMSRENNDGLVRECAAQGIAFVPFFAIASHGREDGVRATESDAVRTVAAAHGASTAQIRLAWTLQRGPHMLAIPGTGNPDHLAENIAAGAITLSPDDLAMLDG